MCGVGGGDDGGICVVCLVVCVCVCVSGGDGV